jgi:uncharacterized protein YjbI with pentapeptide repeats
MELLELLSQGKVEEFNAARGDGKLDFYAADLSGASMVGANLAGANFENADLSGADLTDAILNGATMSGADLTGAKLGGVMAIRSRWREAYIGEADLQDADFTGADLTDAEIPDANASFAIFTSARLKRVVLTGTRLCQADFSECTLKEANLAGTDLEGAILREAHLVGANLQKARLVEADMARVKATGANLSDADLSGARFPHADLTEADLSRAGVEAADFTRADLTSATLTSVSMDDATWTDAQVDGVDTGTLDEAPELTMFHVEDAQIAIRKQSIALAWDNMEPDGRTRLRVIVGAMGKPYERSPAAIPVPTDLVIARAISATRDGFVVLTLVERPGGVAAQLFPISPRGKVGPSRRLNLPYTPAARPVLQEIDGSLVLFGISREGPGLQVHRIGEGEEDALEAAHVSRLATLRGFVSEAHPVVLTKGGTVFELTPSGPSAQIRTPSGFPGRQCGAAPTPEGMALAWMPAGTKGLRIATVVPATTPETDILLPKKTLGTLHMLSESGTAWAAFTQEGDTAADATSAWAICLPDGKPFPVVQDGRDVSEVQLLASGSGPLCSVSFLDGTVEVFSLKNSQARSKWQLG